MIRPKQVLVLAVAGIVLVATGVWLVSRRAADSQLQGPFLGLKQDEVNAVTRLRIFKGDGSHATLTHDTAQWLVSERNYPADTGQVRKLLLDLAALQIEEQKTSDPALYSRLGVEDPGSVGTTSTEVDLDVKGRTLRLIVGKTSGTRAVYVRVAGTPQSLQVSPQVAPDADPRHWLDRTLLDIAPEQVTQVDLKMASQPDYTIRRAAAGANPEFIVAPIPKGREMGDASAAGAQMGALAGLQLDDVRKAGTEQAMAHVTFQTRDGLTLQIAGIQEAEQRYISVSASAQSAAAQSRVRQLNARLSGWEFEVPGYRYETLFRPLEQLLKPPPAPPAPAASTPAHARAAIPAGLPLSPKAAAPGGVTPQQSR